MGDEDVVVDLLSADDIAAVAVDLVIGDFVVNVDVIFVDAENGAARVVVIVPMIVVADIIMLDEYITDDCVIFSVKDGGVPIIVVVAVTGCSDVVVVVVVDVFINCVVSGEGS